MKILFTLLFMGLTSLCYADRICLEKNTGKLIEFQSGDAPLGTLTQNAVNAGYQANNVEEKYVTKEEWKVIETEQIKKPAEDKNKADELARKQKEKTIKTKLGLSDKEFSDLKDALK